jgi:3-deoxy-manno-octulosonate cytidylyltransferase (CMP-KDO synthetase)
MNKIGIIPARLAASRFPGKPMEQIHGMPMIGHCYHRTRLSLGVHRTYVATCDDVIFNYIRSIGGNAIMTSSHHTRATTRTAEALEIIEKKEHKKIDAIIMVQGDEPLILPKIISKTLDHFEDPEVKIVNVMSQFQSLEAFKDKNNVKVVVDCNSNALYFSREPIPSLSLWKGDWNDFKSYMQTGIIAFRRNELFSFNAMEETILEQVESVDMNRILEAGGKIRMILTKSEIIGVDTVEDLIKAKKFLYGDRIMSEYL